jgi:hypothetical protein
MRPKPYHRPDPAEDQGQIWPICGDQGPFGLKTPPTQRDTTVTASGTKEEH